MGFFSFWERSIQLFQGFSIGMIYALTISDMSKKKIIGLI